MDLLLILISYKKVKGIPTHIYREIKIFLFLLFSPLRRMASSSSSPPPYKGMKGNENIHIKGSLLSLHQGIGRKRKDLYI